MVAPINRGGSMLAGTTLALGIVMLVHAGPVVTSDIERSQFDQTTDVTTPLSPLEKTRAESLGISPTSSGTATGT